MTRHIRRNMVKNMKAHKQNPSGKGIVKRYNDIKWLWNQITKKK